MPSDATTVLVVDDDDDMRFLVRTLIEHGAHDVELVGEATDAAEAIERWRAVQPDVVVVDYLMPGRNGLELAMDLRAERADQAVVLFTANADPATVVTAEHLGVAVVSKDQVRDLLDVIRSVG